MSFTGRRTGTRWLVSLGIAGSLFIFGDVNASKAFEEAAKEVERALLLEPNLDNGKKVFLTCSVCHLPEGWGSIDGVYPQIAGQYRSVIIKQLADIRARNRDNPTMRPFTSPQLLGGSQEIVDVAAYIETLPMNPRNGIGPGNELAYGEQLYKDNCVDCHGDKGQGDGKEHIPRIQGQHFAYLIRQFEWIRSGKRRNGDPKMVKQIQRFTPRDVTSVMDYVSRIRPPAEMLAEPGWQNPDFPNYARRSSAFPSGSPSPRQGAPSN